MNALLKTLSYLGLALSVLPSFALAAGAIDRDTSRNLMIAGMLLWFLTAIFWIKPSSLEEGEDS